MNIRTAHTNDLPTIIDMGELLQSESRVYENNLLFNWQESYEHYVKELHNPDAYIIVATSSDEKIIGYQYSFISNLEYLVKNNRECTLEALYVHPLFRGKGIASALIQEAERWATYDMNVHRIKAGIYSGNLASEAVHLKGGFKPYYTEYIKFTDNTK